MGTPIPVIINPSDSGSVYTLSNHHGAVIPHVSLQLIFWGKDWPRPQSGPSSDEITSAVRTMLASPYMSGLVQYGLALGSLRGTTFFPVDPVNPFAKDDWHAVVLDLINNGTFPFPDEPGGRNLYMIVAPRNFSYESDIGGAHGPIAQLDPPADIDTAWGAFVLNNNINLIDLMRSLSHELVEACTDPESETDDGWTIDGLDHPGNEACDVCHYMAAKVGATVEGYWSNFDKACIIPTAFSLRRFLLMKGLDPTKGVRTLHPPGGSVRALIIAG
jgi:hypothetical protein